MHKPGLIVGCSRLSIVTPSHHSLGIRLDTFIFVSHANLYRHLQATNFNHDEAVACFERCIGADPQCAMGYWGIAYASGVNYNK